MSISTQEAVQAWKVAHRFVLDVYRLSNKLPASEQHGLIPKVRTSTVKIASNIVEGYARKSNEFYLRHLSESQVALEETKYSLLVARDLGYIHDQQYDRIMNDAEDLSERLDNLRSQLSGAPELLAPPDATRKTISPARLRDNLTDAWAWFSGGRGKLEERRRQRENNVWVEDHSQVSGYLE